MTTEAQVVRLPCNDEARLERHLRAAWADEDRLEQLLRAARAKARRLEREVGRGRGYFIPIGREKLELALRREEP